MHLRSLFTICLLAATVPSASAGVIATFSTVGATTTGDLAGTAFTITSLGTPVGTPNADLSGAPFSADPGPASQRVLQYASASAWSITFTSSIPTLQLYVILWRPASYTFSLTPTVASGVTNSGLSSNTLTVSNSGFGSGILTFNNVTTLSLSTTFTGGGLQQMQFGTPVPEPGSLPVVTLGLLSGAAMLFRRRIAG